MAVYQDKDKNGKIIKTKDGRSWYFRIYKNGKQYQSKKFLKKDEAEKEEALFKLKKDMPYSKPFDIVAKAYFEEMYKKRKESTVYCYEDIYNVNILPYFKNIDINKIDIQMISGWHDKLNSTTLATSYKNKLNTVLKSILKFAQKNYGLDKNYAEIYGGFEEKNDEIKTDSEKLKYITHDEFKQFISVVDDIMWKNFFLLLYYTGMRIGEVKALKWTDINFNDNKISVTKTLSTKTKKKAKIADDLLIKYKTTNTKTNKNRIVKISNMLNTSLIEYKNEICKFKDFSENWYVFGNTRFLPETTINRYKSIYFKKSGIKEITNHEFRHSHVSLLINEYIKTSKEKNMKIDTAKFFLIMSNRMGHSIKVMQETYMHLFPTIQDEIVDLLDNL